MFIPGLPLISKYPKTLTNPQQKIYIRMKQERVAKHLRIKWKFSSPK